MLIVKANLFIVLGRRIEQSRTVFNMAESHDEADPSRKLTQDELKSLGDDLELILLQCKKLDLPVSGHLICRQLHCGQPLYGRCVSFDAGG
jgi:hypothetical protein